LQAENARLQRELRECLEGQRGRGHRQRGGEEGPAGLEAMIAEWGVQLHKNGQAGAFLFDLARIKPSGGTDTFRKDLRRIAKDAKLPIDEDVFEAISRTDWDILTEEMDVAIETAALEGQEFYISDPPPELQAPDPDDTSWASSLYSMLGYDETPKSTKAIGSSDGPSTDAPRRGVSNSARSSLDVQRGRYHLRHLP